MKSLKEQIAELRAAGYKVLAAQAKVAHDAVLLAMHRSGFKLKSAIKGGVVMSSITGDIRRATMDMDIDIGVHTHDEMAQIEDGFDVVTAPEKAELQANSNEQIFVEKLASLLRHGALSRRPKDVFDMCYLASRMNVKVVRRYVSVLVYASKRCPVSDRRGIVASLNRTFGSLRYMRKLESAQNNWLAVSPRLATETILKVVSAI